MKKEFVKPAVEVVEIEAVICSASCPAQQGGGGEGGGCPEDGLL